jgi:hypothetical protein
VVLVPFLRYFVLYTEIPSLRVLLCCQLTTDKEDPLCSTFYFTKVRVMTNCIHPRNTDFCLYHGCYTNVIIAKNQDEISISWWVLRSKVQTPQSSVVLFYFVSWHQCNVSSVLSIQLPPLSSRTRIKMWSFHGQFLGSQLKTHEESQGILSIYIQLVCTAAVKLAYLQTLLTIHDSNMVTKEIQWTEEWKC